MTILEHEIMMTEQLRRVPADELQARLNKFRAVMDREFPGWEIAIVNHKSICIILPVQCRTVYW